MSNIKLTQEILTRLAAEGVAEWVLCPGGRNAPFVHLLGSQEGLHIKSFFDERSAAFFAYGRAKAIGRPVGVITTSGTAVGELLPAVMEADYSRVPLVLVTADRPKVFRGSGAPQTVNQVEIFSDYVQANYDFSEVTDVPSSFQICDRPVHINVCFDEPLIDSETSLNISPSAFELKSSEEFDIEALKITAKDFNKPLLVLGPLKKEESQWLEDQLKDWPGLIYAEASSQLRESQTLKSQLISSGERFVKKCFEQGLFKSLVRIGGVPCLRFWRDLEKSDIPVISFDRKPFSGLGRFSSGVWPVAAFSSFLEFTETRIDNEEILSQDRKKRESLQNLLELYPDSEPGGLYRWSCHLPEKSRVFLANSLPIREWDMAGTIETNFSYDVVRGVNGIDGAVSTFLGGFQPEVSNHAILGDLTALYDLQGLWALKHLPPDATPQFLVVNNGGGKIFHRLFQNPLFENQHQFQFKGWAEMFGIRYNTWQGEAPDFGSTAVWEWVPDENQTQKFWQKFEDLW